MEPHPIDATATPAPKPVPIRSVTLGLLAGGLATRLQGRDKAWCAYAGVSLIERTLAMAGGGFATRIVSANRNVERYEAVGMGCVRDRIDGFAGPLAGIDALIAACETAWLLTMPIDLRWVPADLVTRLLAEGAAGAVAEDASGLQPLVALWPVAQARTAVAAALANGDGAVHRLVQALALPVTRFDGADFGNLNTPDDFLE